MPRIRISLAERSLEVEGDEEFVERHVEKLEAMFARLVGQSEEAAPLLTAAPPADRDGAGFAELLQALPRTATDVDRMLAAGYFSQRTSGDNCFATAEANRLLADLGFKVGNASQSVKQNLSAKRAFQVQKGRFRVSQSGITHLQQITGGRLAEA